VYLLAKAIGIRRLNGIPVSSMVKPDWVFLIAFSPVKKVMAKLIPLEGMVTVY
jgi:hypothetical protein